MRMFVEFIQFYSKNLYSYFYPIDLEAELSVFTIPPPITTIKPPSLLVEADLKLLEINKRSKLSESVRSTLNRLPMISYMRSKRLMFPVQQQSQD